jgi:hypothetical protein
MSYYAKEFIIFRQKMFEIWRPQDCVEELKRLENHPGFPSGVYLHDPVFNGDKSDYLSILLQSQLQSGYIELIIRSIE